MVAILLFVFVDEDADGWDDNSCGEQPEKLGEDW
jgi:hypothetical protein